MRYYLLILAMLCATLNAQVRKYYYDKEWHGINDEIFATYYVAAKEIPDSLSSEAFRAFDVISGRVIIDGRYSYLDTVSFLNSRFDGDWISYHKNGEAKVSTIYRNGKENGPYVEHNDKGEIIIQGYKLDGKWHGVYEADENNGDHIMINYVDGKAIDDKMIVTNNIGCKSTYRVSDGTLLTENPQKNDMKIETYEGVEWATYDINGITLSIHVQKIKDYGRYYRCDMYMLNHSTERITIDKSNIYAYIKSGDGTYKDLDVYSAKEYSDIIQRKQNVAMAIAAFGTGLSAGMSGYSTSYSTTYMGGYSYSTITTTYNPGIVAANTMVTAAALSSISSDLYDEKKSKEIGYFQPATLAPGQAMNCYINIDYKRANELNVMFTIGGEKYVFTIEVKKSR